MRSEKTSLVTASRESVARSSFVFLIDYCGLNVERFFELRKRLRSVGSDVHVIQNRLFKIVAVEQGWQGLADVLLGPTALITGSDSVATARILKEFKATGGLPTTKAGMEKGAFLTANDISDLASLPSLHVLRGKLVGTIAAPMAGLVGVISQKLLSLVYVLKAVECKRGGADAGEK